MNPLLKSLKARHGIVQTRIEEEQKRPKPDTLRMSALKRLKLHLRDQIALLERMEHARMPSNGLRKPSFSAILANR